MNAISNPPSKKPLPAKIAGLSTSAAELQNKMQLPLQSESWRKINLAGFNISDFAPGQTETALSVSGGSIAVYFHELEKNQNAFSSVLESAETNLKNIPDIFQAQNLGHFQNGVFIQASRNPETVKIRHSFASSPVKGSALLHRVFIHVPDNCELTVLEEFAGTASDEITLWNNHTTVVCGNNASLKYIVSENFSDNEFHFYNFESSQGKDSSIHVSAIHEGGVTGKSFYTAKVRETGGHFRGIGLGLGKNREFNDIEMAVEHLADHSESSLYYRTVLKDRAHSVFTGNLYIPAGLKDVQSRQLNNNILLDKRARAESIPKLVIKAESVQCDHGATVGEINEEAMLYLKCRGIPEDEAKSLLVEGFANEIIDEIPLEEIRENLREAVKGKML